MGSPFIRVLGVGLTVAGCHPAPLDEECSVGEVERIAAAHHLREEQIEDVGTAEAEPAQAGHRDWREVVPPIGAQDDLIFGEEVRDVEADGSQLGVGGVERIPEIRIVIEHTFRT